MLEISDLFIGGIVCLIAIFINYMIIRIAVERGTKYALEQSETYLEIIAKEYLRKQQKESDETNESEDDELIFME